MPAGPYWLGADIGEAVSVGEIAPAPAPFRPFGAGIMFSWLWSVLSTLVGSIDCFRVDPLLVFCTRKLVLGALLPVGDGDLVSESSVVESPFVAPAICVAGVEGPQLHFCFLGMAAVTCPHEQGFEGG